MKIPPPRHRVPTIAPPWRKRAAGWPWIATARGAAAAALALSLSGVVPARSAPVTIKRDTYGVPHIYAKTPYDLFYGYGYAVAEDRLYQMEMIRRSAEGSVSEVLGADYLATDKATRANLDSASIRAQLARLSPRDRAIFEGYAAGFNARVREVRADKPALLPKAFSDGGFEPSTWTSYDVAAIWVGLILNRFFSGNMEVANLNLLNSLTKAKGPVEGEAIYKQLRWLDDPTAPTIAQAKLPRPQAEATPPIRMASYLAAISPVAATADQTHQIAQIGQAAAAGMPTASNAWVLSPSKTVSGHAVLYNGPQQGWFSPSIIYSVGLHGAGFDLVGSTPVGLPAVFFGTNGKIAWGSTVGALDTNDTYQESLDPGDPHRYRYQGRYWPMQVRRETIKVRNAPDETLAVYSARHGTITSWDLPNHTAYALKRSWEGHELETLLGWTYAGQARDWNGFLAQAKRVAASITWFYGDTQGNIGFAALGRLPKRPPNQQIQFPAKGDGDMEWQGALPFSANPKQLNPDQGYFVSWNNKSMPGLTSDGGDFSHVDRVNELDSQIRAKDRLSDAEIWRIDQHGAVADLNLRYFSPYIARAVAALPADAPARRAGDLISTWDGQLVDPDGDGFYDGPAVTVFHAWLPLILKALLEADLPADVYAKYASTGYLPALSPLSAKPGMGAKLLWNALQQGRGGAPFSYDFLHGRDADELITATLAQAMDMLAKTQGSEPALWRSPVSPMQFSSVSAVGVPWAAAAESRRIATYRNRGSVSLKVVLDPARVTMCSAAAPGQSAFVNTAGVADRHYADQTPLFEAFACKPDWLAAEDVDRNREGSKTLSP